VCGRVDGQVHIFIQLCIKVTGEAVAHCRGDVLGGLQGRHRGAGGAGAKGEGKVTR
jgi:hypothetical protein